MTSMTVTTIKKVNTDNQIIKVSEKKDMKPAYCRADGTSLAINPNIKPIKVTASPIIIIHSMNSQKF